METSGIGKERDCATTISRVNRPWNRLELSRHRSRGTCGETRARLGMRNRGIKGHLPAIDNPPTESSEMSRAGIERDRLGAKLMQSTEAATGRSVSNANNSCLIKHFHFSWICWLAKWARAEDFRGDSKVGMNGGREYQGGCAEEQTMCLLIPQILSWYCPQKAIHIGAEPHEARKTTPVIFSD
jgi:hypothetical protein